jgi:hypothetical protein
MLDAGQSLLIHEATSVRFVASSMDTEFEPNSANDTNPKGQLLQKNPYDHPGNETATLG